MKTPNKLIKFAGEKSQQFLSTIKGKKVCDVTRHKFVKTIPIAEAKIPLVQWRGTTESEFFVATFYGGVVTLDINEREMLLGRQETVLIVALVAELEALNKVSKNNSEFQEKLELNVNYMRSVYMTDVENLRFKDIMKVIGWKFASRKVKEDEFCFES